MTTLFDTAPPWFTLALHELGTREIPPNMGAAVQRYCDLAKCGAQGEPWCAIFANAMLESAGLHGTRSAGSQSFTWSPLYITKLAGPALGAIVVFWRGTRNSGLGHVGFYRGEAWDYIYTLGGNEGDMVQIEPFPKDSATFGLVGYFWPVGVPLPTVAPILMPNGTPAHITSVT